MTYLCRRIEYLSFKFKIMKKLVVILVMVGFMAFGALGIQNVVASPAQVEMVKFDKDPKKANDKKVTESKNSKTTDTKAATTVTNASSSSSSDKSASSKGCSDKDRSGCCSSGPGKK
jgi:hypothetical protein